MLFRRTGPEHEAHLLSNRVAIRFSLKVAAAIATERLTLGATRHLAGGPHSRSTIKLPGLCGREREELGRFSDANASGPKAHLPSVVDGLLGWMRMQTHFLKRLSQDLD